MTSSSPASEKTKASHVAIVLVLIAVIIAAVVGIPFLNNPYYAIAHAGMYAVAFTGVAIRLRDCLRLAVGTEYRSKLHGVAFWLVLSGITFAAYVGDLFSTEDRNFVKVATGVTTYLALYYSLQLVERLLKKTVPTPKPDSADGSSPGAVGPS